MTRGTPPNDLRYELASRDDTDRCNTLNNEGLKRTRSLAQWEWEFVPPHLPFDQIPYAVARDGSEIVGTQGYIIVPMLSETGPFWTAKGEDAFVQFKYWNRNALSGLWTVLIAFCERNNIPLVWGFNSRRASFSKVGLRYFDEPVCADYYRSLDRRAMDTVLQSTSKMKKRFDRLGGDFAKAAVSVGTSVLGDTRMLASRSARFVAGRAPKNVVIENLSGPPGEEFETLSHRFIRHYGGMTLHRSPVFLKWRLLDNPFLASTIITARVHGELYGYIAFALAADSQAYISDEFICVPDGGAEQNCAIAELLIAAVISRVRARKASVLHMQSFNAHPADVVFRQAARRMGFLSRARSVGACYRLVPGAGEPPKSATNYDEWYVTSTYNEGRQG